MDYFTIGQVSKMCSISVQTLRYYDKVGILVPDYKDDGTGYRYYSFNNIVKLHLLKSVE